MNQVERFRQNLYHLDRTHFYYTDGYAEEKKGNGVKKCTIKGRLKFEYYKKRLENNKIILRSQQRLKSEVKHRIYLLKRLTILY